MLQSTFTFNGQPLTVTGVQRTVGMRVADLLATITGDSEVRASTIDGFSANILAREHPEFDRHVRRVHLRRRHPR